MLSFFLSSSCAADHQPPVPQPVALLKIEYYGMLGKLRSETLIPATSPGLVVTCVCIHDDIGRTGHVSGLISSAGRSLNESK